MIYLATPYSDPDLNVRNWRYNRAREALFHLWDQQAPAVCPVVLGHIYEQRQRGGARDQPHEFWMVMARAQLVACTHVYVLTLPGWDQSRGVREEVLMAHGLGKGIIGYQNFPFCEDAGGVAILRTFGVKLAPRVPLDVPTKLEEE